MIYTIADVIHLFLFFYLIVFQAGENMNRPEADEMSRLPFLRRWFRTRSAIVLHLSNGTLQVIVNKELGSYCCICSEAIYQPFEFI